MKKTILGGAIAAAMLMAATGHAQTFTYEVTWGDVDQYGGIGPNGTLYRGGTVDGTYVTTYGDGNTTSGTIRCTGVDQPPGSMFFFHLACDATGDTGSAGIGYGCNFLGEPGPNTAVSCVGGMHAREGENAGRTGNLTMYWYAEHQSRGTGQWFNMGE